MAQFEPVVLVHGGAGDIPDSRDEGKHNGTRMAARRGFAVLERGGSALDAVEEAVRSMELDPYFNCGNFNLGHCVKKTIYIVETSLGYGSVLNIAGKVSMDASIQDGRTLGAGAVTMVQDILHPITVARRVLESPKHNFYGGEGAMQFARDNGIVVMDPPGQLVTEYARQSLDYYLDQLSQGIRVNVQEVGHKSNANKIGEVGTVGAVAMDRFGNVAAATSTGGMTGKDVGRIGDSPIIGAGTNAENRVGAVSTTGNGETILQFNVAGRIMSRMELLGESSQLAAETVLRQMTERLNDVDSEAGVISIDAKGTVGIHWTSKKMAWAYQQGDLMYYGIKHGDRFVENAYTSVA